MSADPELVEVEDDGLLPLVARLGTEPLRLLVKSGRVGGAEGERGSLAITPQAREAALAAACSADAEWEKDPDLGWDLLVSEVDGVDQGLLIPRFLYRRADRFYEYAAAVAGARDRFAGLRARSRPVRRTAGALSGLAPYGAPRSASTRKEQGPGNR